MWTMTTYIFIYTHTHIYVYAHEMCISNSDKAKAQFSFADDGFVHFKRFGCKSQCPSVYNENYKLIYSYLIPLTVFGGT